MSKSLSKLVTQQESLFLDLLNADEEHMDAVLQKLEEANVQVAQKIDAYVYVNEKLENTEEIIDNMIDVLKQKKKDAELKRQRLADRLHEFFNDGTTINGEVFAIKTYSTVRREVAQELLSDEERGRGVVTLTCKASDIPEGFNGDIKGVKFLLADFPEDHQAIQHTTINRFKTVKKE